MCNVYGELSRDNWLKNIESHCLCCRGGSGGGPLMAVAVPLLWPPSPCRVLPLRNPFFRNALATCSLHEMNMWQVGLEALENLFSNFCTQNFKLNRAPKVQQYGQKTSIHQLSIYKIRNDLVFVHHLLSFCGVISDNKVRAALRRT